MPKNAKIAIALIALIASYLLGAVVKWPLGNSGDAGRVKVTGTGTVMATPDQMRVNLTVRTRGAAAAQALKSASDTMTKVLAALNAAAIDKKDITTTQISTEPDITYGDKRGQKVTGYIARQSISVTVRDLSKGGSLLSSLAAAGGDDLIIESTELKVSSKNAALDQARVKALKAARAKAELYASVTGRSLGPVISVVESGGSGTATSVLDARVAAKGGDVPITPGETKIKVAVSTTWRLN